MTLPRWTLPLGCLLACLFARPLAAAEVMVSPGTGILAAVIAAASDGDVLVLPEGAYAIHRF